MAQGDNKGEHELSGADWLRVISDWPNAQLRLRERWSRLDEAALEDTGGNRVRLVEKLRDAYGFSKQEAERQIDDFVETTWGGLSAGKLAPNRTPPGGMPRRTGLSSGTPSTAGTGPRGGRTSGTRTTSGTGVRGHRPAGGKSGA